jgi:hypothetical protein
MQFPGDGIEHSGQTVLGYPTAKERIRGKCSERIVADFGVRRGRSLVHEVNVDISGDWGSVEEDEPDVYSQFRLSVLLVVKK